jgi:hypothetical protein
VSFSFVNRGIAAGIVAICVSWLLVAPPAAAQSTLDQYAAACERERDAASRYYQGKGQLLEDQNALKELGFPRTADQLESLAGQMKDQMQAMEQFRLKKQLTNLIYDQAAKKLRAIGVANQKVVLSRPDAIALREQVLRDPAAKAVLDRAFDEANARVSSTVTFGGSGLITLADFALKLKKGLGAADTAQQINAGEINNLDASFKTAESLASFVGPEAKMPIEMAHEATDLVRLGINWHDVDKLMALNDAQQKQLDGLRQRVKVDTDRLHRAHLDLQAAQAVLGGSCDSTKLVKREPDQPQPSDPPPTPISQTPSTKRPPKKPTHTGMSTGAKVALATSAVAGGTLLAAAAAAAVNTCHTPSMSDPHMVACQNARSCSAARSSCAAEEGSIASDCECLSKHHPEASGACDQIRQAEQLILDVYCGPLPPAIPFTPATPMSRLR